MTLTVFFVSDQRRAAGFYRSVLDVEPTLDEPGMTELPLPGGGTLGIMPIEGIHRLLPTLLTDRGGVPKAELYVRSSDPAAMHERALRAGATELQPLTPMDWGDVVAYALDPEGYLIASADRAAPQP